MSLHIEAKKGEIAKIVLMSGDPLRVEYIAKNFLKNAILVNKIRNNYAYTGLFNNTMVTVMASGMGMPSIGIYSYELYKEYDVDVIIRIGSAGAYSDSLKLFDIVLASEALSESTYAKCIGLSYENNTIEASSDVNNLIVDEAKKLNILVKIAKIHSSDAFYSPVFDYKKALEQYGVECVEMEAFALFANAKLLNKKAACLVTISDTFTSNEKMSALDRQTKLNEMIKLALYSAEALNK